MSDDLSDFNEYTISRNFDENRDIAGYLDGIERMLDIRKLMQSLWKLISR